MPIEVREVSGRKDLKRFIFLPEKIHRDHASWIPPIYMDEWSYFDPKKNRSYAMSEAALAIAWRDGKPVGRIMGIIPTRLNESAGTRTARFSQLDCFEDKDAFDAISVLKKLTG